MFLSNFLLHLRLRYGKSCYKFFPKVTPEIVNFCKRLLHAASGQIFTCSVTGVYETKQQVYISDLYAVARNVICNYYQDPELKCEHSLNVYLDESKRLESFSGNWALHGVPSALAMAKAGFFFLAKPAAARCFSCGYIMCSWDGRKDPLFTHAQTFPECKFVIENLAVEEIPTIMKLIPDIKESFSTIEARFASLEMLPKYIHGERYDLEDIAMAGFYLNTCRYLKCFSCGISVSAHHLKDRPCLWTLHGVLSSDCEYLLNQKGKDFVDAIHFANRINYEPTIVTLQLMKVKDEIPPKFPGLFLFLVKGTNS